jgi:hypothetical protein
MAACTCAACGIVTTGLGAFDKHQDVDYSRRPAVTCRNPEALGMVRNHAGRWGFPLDDAGRAFFASLRAVGRSSREQRPANHPAARRRG